MKILFAACLFLYLAAVYGQEDSVTPVTKDYSLRPPVSRLVCQRTPTYWRRASFSLLYTNTNGVRKRYVDCRLYYVRQTGCRESGRGCPSSYVTYYANPLRTSSRCQCCRPTRVWTIRPTMYCSYVWTYICPPGKWILRRNVRVRDHPYNRRYTYRYVLGCSCQNCVGGLPFSPVQLAAERGDESDQEQVAIADINQIPEFKADRETEPNSNPPDEESDSAFRLIPSQGREQVCGASSRDSHIEA